MVVLHVLFVDDESRGDSICHFACLLFQVMKLPFHNFLFFLARSSLDRHRPFDPVGSASPPQVAQSFRQPFATSRVKSVNIKRFKKTERKHKEMPSQADVPRPVCVTQSQETHHCFQTLPKQKKPTHFHWLILVHQLRPSVMLKSRQQETSFSDLGDHSHHCLHSFLLVTCLVLCHRISLGKTSGAQKKKKKNENKNKEMKREKSDFL